MCSNFWFYVLFHNLIDLLIARSERFELPTTDFGDQRSTN